MKHYIKHHAIRKSDVAWASGTSRPTKRTGRTGVKGTGRYKTWTPQMMLKSAFLGKLQLKVQLQDFSLMIIIIYFFLPGGWGGGGELFYEMIDAMFEC